jgi:hypothetical protein
MSKCSLCGDYRGFPEIEYPGVKPETVFDQKTLRTLIEMRNPKADWPEFLKLRSMLKKQLPATRLVAPACGFGPVLAKVFRKFDGFTCGGLARLVASAEVVAALDDLGIKLTTYPTVLTQNGAGKGKSLLYIHAPMLGQARPEYGISICPECCRPSRPQPTCGNEVLLPATLPEHEPLFRLSYAPTTLIFRRDLKDLLVDRFGIKGIQFTPIKPLER